MPNMPYFALCLMCVSVPPVCGPGPGLRPRLAAPACGPGLRPRLAAPACGPRCVQAPCPEHFLIGRREDGPGSIQERTRTEPVPTFQAGAPLRRRNRTGTGQELVPLVAHRTTARRGGMIGA